MGSITSSNEHPAWLYIFSHPSLLGGGIPCPVCGETYGTHDNLQRHIQYNAMMEAADPNVPVQGSHQTLAGQALPAQPLEMSQQEIRNSLQDKEVMVVCEGIEPLIFYSISFHKYIMCPVCHL